MFVYFPVWALHGLRGFWFKADSIVVFSLQPWQFGSYPPLPLSGSPLGSPEPILISGRGNEATLGLSVTLGDDLILILCIDSKIGHLSCSWGLLSISFMEMDPCFTICGLNSCVQGFVQHFGSPRLKTCLHWPGLLSGLKSSFALWLSSKGSGCLQTHWPPHEFFLSPQLVAQGIPSLLIHRTPQLPGGPPVPSFLMTFVGHTCWISCSAYDKDFPPASVADSIPKGLLHLKLPSH